MVDPIKFTNFNRTTDELEEVLLFTVLVAGKNALTTAKSLDKLLHFIGWRYGSPFEYLKKYTQPALKGLLHIHGIGCYTHKAKAVHQLVNSELDLKKCTTDDLEGIYGIGPKSSRMFILHTRPNSRVACLDVHILHYLRDKGYDVPKVTPSSKKKYKDVEDLFLEVAKGKNIAEFDLEIWNLYRKKKYATAS